MKQRKSVIVISALLMTILVICIFFMTARNDETPIEVNTAETEESVLIQEIDETETLEEERVPPTMPIEETQSNKATLEVTVLESTPDLVKVEIKDESGKHVQAQMGVVEGKPVENGPDDDPVSNTTPTKPTQPKPTEPKPTEPKPTQPKPTEPKPTEPKPSKPTTGGTKVEEPGADVTFTEYEAMSGEEQMLFYYTFADANAFNSWYETAKAAHNAGRDEIIIGDDGAVNLG